MTASAAITGYGTIVKVRTGASPPAWFTLGEVASVTPPSGSADEVEVTHLTSPNRTKEYIQGLIDLGEVPLKINWIPGNTTDEFLLDWQEEGDNREVQIVYPNQVTDTFPAFVKTYSGEEITPEGKMSGSVALRVAGAKERGEEA